MRPYTHNAGFNDVLRQRGHITGSSSAHKKQDMSSYKIDMFIVLRMWRAAYDVLNWWSERGVTYKLRQRCNQHGGSRNTDVRANLTWWPRGAATGLAGNRTPYPSSLLSATKKLGQRDSLRTEDDAEAI